MKIAWWLTLVVAMAPDAGPGVAPAAVAPPAPAPVPNVVAAPPPAPGRSLAEVTEQVKPAVVNIQLLDAADEIVSQGTGFFVVRDDLVATNHHVIDGAQKVRVTLADGRVFDAPGVVAEQEDRDLALLKLAQKTGAPQLALGSTKGLQQGTDVLVIGNPTGLSGTLSSGVVSALRERGLEGETGVFAGRLVQITAPISPGSSGSPVVTMDGAVIGVAVGQRTSGQNLNFVVPVEDLAHLLAAADPDRTTRAFGGQTNRNLFISLGFFLVLAVAYATLTRKKKPRPRVH